MATAPAAQREPIHYNVISQLPYDTVEDEVLYAKLVKASRSLFNVDQVRLLKRAFNRADKDRNGIVETAELELMLKTISSDVTSRVVKELIDACEHQALSFPAFIQLLCSRLSTDEALLLLAMEDNYIRSMGIDAREQREFEAWRLKKDERRRSSACAPLKPNNRTSRRASTEANDVAAYVEEFGLGEPSILPSK